MLEDGVSISITLYAISYFLGNGLIKIYIFLLHIITCEFFYLFYNFSNATLVNFLFSYLSKIKKPPQHRFSTWFSFIALSLVCVFFFHCNEFRVSADKVWSINVSASKKIKCIFRIKYINSIFIHGFFMIYTREVTRLCFIWIRCCLVF